VVLKGGEVQETGTTAGILSAAQHPYTRELLAAFEPKSRQIRADEDSGPKPLLRIDNLIAGYGPVKRDGQPVIRAVDSVSLIVEKGRNLGVIGESGCGKSTLARAIAGIHPAATGDIVFDGKAL
ncbi:MAG: ATP-binding cassette domain-containing protein, partial [Mesorhizobium sp.]